MVRMLARTAVVLVLAAAVAAALYFAVGGPLLGDDFGDHRDGWHGRSPAHGGHPDREEASVGHGVAGMAGTALEIGFVGAAVVGLQRRSRRRHR